MSEATTRSGLVSKIAQERKTLTSDFASKNASLSALQKELKSSSGAEKDRLLSTVKQAASSVQLAMNRIDLFETQILLPHLQLAGITIYFPFADRTEFETTVWVRNNGILPALGSFELDLSVSYYTYEQDPPLLVNANYSMTTPDSMDIQPGAKMPFLFPNVAFVTKPGSASALYTFDVLLYAGPDGVVADQNLHQQFLLRPPRVGVPRPIWPVSPPAHL
jgi:hypothetical protein